MGKNILFSILSGLLLAAGFPSHGFPILLFFAFVPLLLTEHKIAQSDKKRRALRVFELSFITFFIWNGIAIYWLSNCLRPDGSTAWEAYLLPVFLNAIFMSVVFLGYHWVKRTTGNFYGIASLPVFWMSFEKLHLGWDFNWPWLNLGNGFANYYQWIQWYEFTGTFGGTLWIWILNFVFFYGIVAHKNTQEKKYLYKMGAFSFLLIVIPIAISLVMYYNYEEKGKSVNVLVLQPKLDPYKEKYTKSSEEITDDLVLLVDKNIEKNTQFVIAPETAFPGAGLGVNINKIQYDPALLKFKTWLQKYPQLTFVSGVEMFKVYDNKALATTTASAINTTGMYIDSYNSSIQLNNKDSLVFAHKSKLVPGVEILPYFTVIKPILGDLMLNFGGNSNTLGVQQEKIIYTNTFNSAKIAPIICYESVFGEYVSEFVKKGANVIFIPTNDAWWGNSDGHKELLAFTQLRAIENRRDIARAANSGVSCFINQRGDVVASLPYDTKGALNYAVFLNEEKTNYTLYGDVLARIALLLTGILLAYSLSTNILEVLKRKNILTK